MRTRKLDNLPQDKNHSIQASGETTYLLEEGYSNCTSSQVQSLTFFDSTQIPNDILNQIFPKLYKAAEIERYFRIPNSQSSWMQYSDNDESEGNRIDLVQKDAVNVFQKTLLSLRGVNKHLNQVILSHPDFKALVDMILSYPNVLNIERVRSGAAYHECFVTTPRVFLVGAFAFLLLTILVCSVLEMRRTFNSTDASGSLGIIVKRDVNAVEMEEMMLDASNQTSVFSSPQSRWAFGVEIVLTFFLISYNIINFRAENALYMAKRKKDEKEIEFKSHIINRFSIFSDKNKLPGVEEGGMPELSGFTVKMG